MATTDHQTHLSDTAVLLARLGFLDPGRFAGPESVGKINLQLILHSYIVSDYPSAGCVSGHQ